MAPGFSITAFVSLIAIFAASVWVYLVLVQRTTTFGRTLELEDWASNRDLTFHSPQATAKWPPALPALITSLSKPPPTVGIAFTARRTGRNAGVMILQLFPPLRPAVIPTQQSPATWNLLLRPLPQPWPATALRPASVGWSAIDALRLTTFASPLSSPRFVMLGDSAAAAKALARSAVRSQLPPDYGLVLTDSLLLLDFSTRPFDPLELSRVLEVSETVLRNLPPLE